MLRKKLIEVALPLDAINKASAREKSIRHGHPSTLHLWWARRPLAAARAVIFAQMVDDPSSWPELFPTEAEQEKERQRLFRLIEEMVRWENTTNEELLDEAREEIRVSWRRTCAENQDHPRASELFDPERLPAFHDPFAGGGTLPLEAQRLGLEAYASDLNPVAVLINKAMIEIPPKFAGMPPVNPEWRAKAKDNPLEAQRQWKGAQGLAEDVRYYGKWMRDEAEKRIGHLYPKIEVTAEMAKERPDLQPYVGRKLTVIAWLWARTVKSPNPAFRDVDVPLASTFMLSKKRGREAYVEPVLEKGCYRFDVRAGTPPKQSAMAKGTKESRANFRCLMSGGPISGTYIKKEGAAGRIGARLMAIVAEGDGGRVYLSPTLEHEEAAQRASPAWQPSVPISGSTQYIGVRPYGMDHFDLLFTPRQTEALNVLSELIGDVRGEVLRSLVQTDCAVDPFDRGGDTREATAYAQSMALYMALSVGRQANRSSNLNFWDPVGAKIQQVFARQAISMVWDFVESNPFSRSSGNFLGQLGYLATVVALLPAEAGHFQDSVAIQHDAVLPHFATDTVISTDPPYYDNIPYSDLSDFFYVWLRRSLASVMPDLFTTLRSPKDNELVAFAHRHGGKSEAESFFLAGMTQAIHQLSKQTHPACPVTIYYAFRQMEKRSEGIASTGWEVFLEAVIESGLSIHGTWPIRTEYTSQLKTGRSALASSIVLVCRKQTDEAPLATRRQFVSELKSDLPKALLRLQSGHIAPVDLAQAAIGPGMAVYTRYAKVLDTSGDPVTVREALVLINETLDEVLTTQEGDFDADTRWALAWFEQHGFEDGDYGVAETLSKAKNTSVGSLKAIGILQSKGGKVRLLIPLVLAQDWDPQAAARLSAWLTVHHLIRVHDAGGEQAAAALVRKLGSVAETGRELAYRLYALAERTKRSREALWYNALVKSCPEIARLAREDRSEQTELLAPLDGV